MLSAQSSFVTKYKRCDVCGAVAPHYKSGTEELVQSIGLYFLICVLVVIFNLISNIVFSILMAYTTDVGVLAAVAVTTSIISIISIIAVAVCIVIIAIQTIKHKNEPWECMVCLCRTAVARQNRAVKIETVFPVTEKEEGVPTEEVSKQYECASEVVDGAIIHKSNDTLVVGKTVTIRRNTCTELNAKWDQVFVFCEYGAQHDSEDDACDNNFATDSRDIEPDSVTGKLPPDAELHIRHGGDINGYAWGFKCKEGPAVPCLWKGTAEYTIRDGRVFDGMRCLVNFEMRRESPVR